MTMFKYDEATLKKIQETELEIIRCFDSFCLKHGISYFCVFGTEIGAVRHKGFIPWDDDTDLGMLREDYDKFLALRDEFAFENGGGYYLVDPVDKAPYHEKCFSRIYKRDTIFSMDVGNGNYHMRKNQHKPIGIDIFVFDYVGSLQELKERYPHIKRLKQLYLYSKFRVKIIKGDNIKTIVKKAVIFSVYCLNRILNGAINKCAYKKYVGACISEPTDYITTFGSWEEDEVFSAMIDYKGLFPIKRVPYESIIVSLRSNYDAALRKLYGDYMTVPPEEKRVNHPPICLDFGEERYN